jgi:hypothetical protein
MGAFPITATKFVMALSDVKKIPRKNKEPMEN